MDVVWEGKHGHVVWKWISAFEFVVHVFWWIAVKQHRLILPLQGVLTRIDVERLGGGNDGVVAAKSLGSSNRGYI